MLVILSLAWRWPYLRNERGFLYPLPHSPTAVRQYISFPSLELVGTAYLFQYFLTWLQAQMIRVVQA